MRRHATKLAAIGMLAAMVAACSSTPDYVIPEHKMELLLTDIYAADGMTEVNRGVYHADSTRKLVKQSVLLKHGITQEQLDTSFMWYGAHLEDYLKIYDKVIKRLKERMDTISDSAEHMALTVIGDSADAWSNSRIRMLSLLYPNNLIDFDLEADDTWQRGDVYEWKLKVWNNRGPLILQMAVDYDDSITEYTSRTFDGEGWHSLELGLDSTRTAQRVYGFGAFDLNSLETIIVDSISLIRTRAHRPNYYSLRHSLKRIDYGNKD